MQNIKTYIENNKDRFINELLELLKIPSISADSAFKNDILKTAEAVKTSLEKAGCDHVEICATDGHPIVYGEKIIDKTLPTVLVYGHYDVQPPDPLNLWASPPFEPVIKKTDLHPEGAIFARGSCDDKGQMYMHVKAVRDSSTILASPTMSPPVNRQPEKSDTPTSIAALPPRAL
jgi:acetylornithine deacetylase/succinyl-diaminopimelate desuccinylase-like protein